MTTQTQLSAFNFENAAIRVITIDNEPWFVAKDICEALNLSNSRMALLPLDDDEKGVSSTYTLGGEQDLAIVSESGMYTLILRCRDAVKKGSVPHRFRKWVTAEVLPQIRKTGQFLQKNEESRPLAKPERTITIRLLESDVIDLAWLWFGASQMNKLIGQLTPALEALGSHLAPTAHSHFHEYGNQLAYIGPLIYKLSKDADFGSRPTPLNALSQAIAPHSTAVARR